MIAPGSVSHRLAMARLVSAGPWRWRRCPGGHMQRAGEQVAFVVVAPPVGQHPVLDGVDTALGQTMPSSPLHHLEY
jgi:hypothetical protein